MLTSQKTRRPKTATGSSKYIYGVKDIQDLKIVVDGLLMGTDISLVDPIIFPELRPYIYGCIESLRATDETYKMNKLRFYIRYIDEQPRRDAISKALSGPKIVIKARKPVMSSEEVKQEVQLILETGQIKDYSQEQLKLLIEGMNQERARLIELGEYIQAKKADHYAQQLFPHSVFSSFETIQAQKVQDLHRQLSEGLEALVEQKRKWEEIHEGMKRKRDEEFRKMEKNHRAEQNEIEILYDADLPPSIHKYSRNLLQLRSQQKAMLASRMFQEASVMKERADALQAEEDRQQRATWHAQLDLQMSNLIKKQAKQLESRKQFWRKEEHDLIMQANLEISHAESALQHLQDNLISAQQFKETASLLRKETKNIAKGTSKAECPKLLNQNSKKYQRQVVTHKIYTRPLSNQYSPRKMSSK